MEFSVEPMTAGDWPEVREIYEEGILTGQATFESEVPFWEHWDETHLAECRLVARSSEGMLGWAALSPVSRRSCYAGVAEVSVYVRAAVQGEGVGRRLLEELIISSEEHGIWTLQGVTLAENEASLRLQAKCGFRIVGRRERVARKDGVWRDTVLAERRSQKVGVK
jgi:L-amino acid N-acyltransferase YncA